MNKVNYKEYLTAKDFLYSLISLPKPSKYCQKSMRVGKQRFLLKDEGCVGLERIKELLARLNNPERNLSFIHVAGTAGKGSVVAMLRAILSEAGFKTACFTSPHLSSPLERFQIDNKLMPAVTFVELVRKIKPVIEDMYLESPYGVPSYFETLWAIALLWFSQEKPDWVIVEAGIGGALDSTNIIMPKLCLITDIAIDHAGLIGPRLIDIAVNKAGIIKPKIPVLVSCRKKQVIEIIQQKAKECQSPFERLGKDFWAEIIKRGENSIQFEYQDAGTEKSSFYLALAGRYQLANAALAIRAAQLLAVNKEKIKSGLKKVFWPVRMEIVSARPKIILDGAHNPAKMKALAESLIDFSYKKLLVILGIMENKDVKGIIKALQKVADKIFITRVNVSGRHAAEPSKIYELCHQSGLKAEVVLWPDDALDMAVKEAGPKDLILVTGSLFLAGKIREKWLPEEQIVLGRSLKIR